MCLEFGSCFGGRTRDDYGVRGRSRGNGYWSAPALPPAPEYHQPPASVHEAGHKANHDGAPNADHGDAGCHAAYLQDKAGSETPPKLPARQNKVSDDAGYTYTPRPHQSAADHREGARRHGLPPAPNQSTTTTTLARYQVASC